MKISEAAKKAAEAMNPSGQITRFFPSRAVAVKHDEKIVQSAIDSETRELREALKIARAYVACSRGEAEGGFQLRQKTETLKRVDAALSKAGAE